MAALTKDRAVPAHGGDWGQGPNSYADLPVAASTAIYKGGFVGLSATGYLERYVSSATGTALTGKRYVGIAQEAIASQTADGDKKCRVQIAGYFRHALSGVAVGDVGKPVFASDDNTLSIVSAGNSLVGRIVEYNATDATALILMPDLGENGAFFVRTAQITHTASHTVRLIHPTENHNGVLILWAGELITVASGAAASVITLRDTVGTTTGITFTSTSDAIGDIVPGAANTMAIGAASGSALVQIPADLGLDAFVTTAGTSGAGTIIVLGVAL